MFYTHVLASELRMLQVDKKRGRIATFCTERAVLYSLYIAHTTIRRLHRSPFIIRIVNKHQAPGKLVFRAVRQVCKQHIRYFRQTYIVLKLLMANLHVSESRQIATAKNTVRN